ncbi:FAD-dependent oxidoreductase [Aliikangiella maris]|uniref:NAD(P)/FAD-dependent oxidoreductase n=2 Tax=Aliikangiella maris TaxID=3162458 RepID=A0ABV3ML86_9GAMM
MAQKIAIIGGGIAGLAFAVYYQSLGGEVDIYERSSKSGREGLGFIMLENGLNAMQGLGLRNHVKHNGFPVEHCHIRDNFNNLLINQSLPGSYGITRKAFVDILLEKLPQDRIHFDYEFSHFEWQGDNSNSTNQSSEARCAVFTNGKKVSADLFIGSDGAGSPVRKQIFPQATRSSVKCKELVSVVKAPDLVSQMNQTFTKYKSLDGGLAVGTVATSEDTIVWFIQFSTEKYDEQLAQLDKQSFAETLVGDWPPLIQSLIRQTDFNQSYLALSAHLNPIEQFFAGNVVLMGDAAHALLPFTSQGVNSAIEDAIELARTLQNTKAGYSAVALAHYSSVRRNIVNQYLAQGIALQEEFLAPHQADQKIPFAF